MLARTEAPPVRVNVGCGKSPTPGWLNIDNSPTLRLAPVAFLLPRNQRGFLRIAREMNVRYGTATRLPLGNHTADVIYSSHMLEHLDRAEARAFLAEAFRVLKPGGVIRLVVPDLKILARRYLEAPSPERADWFVSSTQLGYERPRSLRAWLRQAIFGRREHCWMYDAPSLAALLTRAGFRAAVAMEEGETTIADPGGLNVTERVEWSACVEAVRP